MLDMLLKMVTRVKICQHGFSRHLPKEHIDLRYPFTSNKLEVIALRDEERYNREVRPSTITLQQGICILRELHPSDPDGAARLNWYTPTTDALTCNRRVPLSGYPRPHGKMCRTSPSLDFQAVPGCARPWRP